MPVCVCASVCVCVLVCVCVCRCVYVLGGWKQNLSLWVYTWLLTPHPGEEERSKHVRSPLLTSASPL